MKTPSFSSEPYLNDWQALEELSLKMNFLTLEDTREFLAWCGTLSTTRSLKTLWLDGITFKVPNADSGEEIVSLISSLELMGDMQGCSIKVQEETNNQARIRRWNDLCNGSELFA